MRTEVNGFHGNHWIVLDRTWAKRLGVIRSSGVYRISSRDLILRLAEHHPMSGT